MNLQAIDINIPANKPVKNEGVAYYRLENGLFEFLKLCEEKRGILGFEWNGSRNFGVILRNPAKEI